MRDTFELARDFARMKALFQSGFSLCGKSSEHPHLRRTQHTPFGSNGSAFDAADICSLADELRLGVFVAG